MGSDVPLTIKTKRRWHQVKIVIVKYGDGAFSATVRRQGRGMEQTVSIHRGTKAGLVDGIRGVVTDLSSGRSGSPAPAPAAN